MYPNWQTHLEHVLSRVIHRVSSKYEKGQKAHAHEGPPGIWNKPVLFELQSELDDAEVYIDVLKEQLAKCSKLAGEIIAECGANEPTIETKAKQIYNILTYGNPEGKK